MYGIFWNSLKMILMLLLNYYNHSDLLTLFFPPAHLQVLVFVHKLYL